MQPYRIDIEIHDETLKAVLIDLKIEHKPPSITTNFQDVKALSKKSGYESERWGMFDPAKNHVFLQTLPASYARLPLFHLQPFVREVLLHELRHAHQFECWPEERRKRMLDGPYWLRDAEKDARRWSYKAHLRPDWRPLLKVTRQALGEPTRLP